MRLSLCIVTHDVPRLRRFYEWLLQVPPVGDDTYAELRPSEGWVLALCAREAIEFAAPGAHVPELNRSVRIELAVDDVDAECARIAGMVEDWVTPPTDWPWGTRAAWLRDPDGNLISLFQPSR